MGIDATMAADLICFKMIIIQAIRFDFIIQTGEANRKKWKINTSRIDKQLDETKTKQPHKKLYI